jgi:stress response protein YsnF
VTSITTVLKDNPQYSIELIGHSSIEDGKEENNVKISAERVNNIKSVFLQEGVPEYQIKSNSLGSAKPIYFLPSTEWQQHYNRRVEVRWIKPGDLPYEIIAQEYWTEEEAQKQVNEWQAKGFRAYFERYLVNNRPAYKVKLWGFESKDQALSEAKKLKASYKFDFLVE